MSSLSAALGGRRILFGVTGSIAAYKAPHIYRELRARGADVSVLLTHSAQKFIGKAAFTGLGASVYTDMWDGPGEPHVSLSRWAEALLVAPTTADRLAGLRMGTASDLLGATSLCFQGPVCLAPAMHPSMWAAPATQDNVRHLASRGVHFLGPVDGEVASGDRGIGRMMSPETIVARLAALLAGRKQSLSGRHLVVTAGPTREAIDPVRALTNLSTGKMGYAIAAAAADRGARVTLISGPVALLEPEGVTRINIESTAQLEAALDQVLGRDLEGADALIMAAAVSDYRPFQPSEEKLKRSGQELTLRLVPNPDLLSNIGRRRTRPLPVLVGFALETRSEEALSDLGRKKLVEKRADLIVANLAIDSLGQDENKVQLVSAEDSTPLDRMSKAQVAGHILDWVEQRLLE